MLTNDKKRMLSIITILVMTVSALAVLPAATAKVYGATQKGTIKNGPLNVRSGAGTSYKKLGTIAKGKTITIKSTKKDKNGSKWYAFNFNSKTGYVSSTYVTVKSNSASSSVKPYSPSKKGTVKQGPLTVRSGAGKSYKKVGSYAKGKKITLTGEKKASNGEKWYRLTYNSKAAYVHSKYVTVSTGAVTITFNKKATVKSGPLNVRSGPGSSYSKLGSLAQGAKITLKAKVTTKSGDIWYKYAFSSSKSGYISAKYVTIDSESSTGKAGSNLSDAEFEKWMTSEGFPSSYKAKLRTLHKQHPEWIFKTQKTNLNWSEMLSRECKVGVNLVEPTSPTSWKSKAKGAYDSATGTYTKFDGRWNAASESITAYYMDPRNFLTSASIYQFMDHKFDSKSQTKDTIKSMVNRSNCFMNTSTYITYLYNSGSKSKVNPNVITAMVIMEQGWKGTSGLISGTYPGYKGYYNYFNIGAYTAGNMSAVERGLWWAKGAGTGDTSYNRPWNTKEKALTGGASYYSKNYVEKKQHTYYTKKFNVMNGLSNVPTHQYMTNVSGADSEGKILKYAYEKNDKYPITFYIPVYNSMPSKVCSKPV